MQEQRLAEIIKNPFYMDSETMVFLEELRDRYPYCQTVQILLAKCYQKQGSNLFEGQVNLASAYSVDRHRFQNYISEKSFYTGSEGGHDHFSGRQASGGIDPEGSDVEPGVMAANDEKKEDAVEPANEQTGLQKPANVYDSQLQSEKQKNRLEKIVNDRLKFVAKKNIAGSKKETPVIPAAKLSGRSGRTKGSRADQLIEKFIREEPAVSAPKKTAKTTKEDLASESVKFYDDIVSETLAQIYLKQGKTDRALNIYKKLSLQFPEKSSIFAKKIKQIKRK